jgi:hypothetical protein
MTNVMPCPSVATRGTPVKNASRRQGGGLKAVLDRGPNAPPSGLQAATKKRPRSAEQRNITGYDAMAFAHIDGHNS